MIKKLLCLLALVAVVTATGSARVITVVDSGDREPIAGASVLSSNGLIVGFTDSQGRIQVAPADYPLELRGLGYMPLSVEATVDTVAMSPAAFPLGELTVNPADRPITRVVTYAQEYCTGATPGDTMQMYSEYMLEYFLADGKVKGYSKSDAKASVRNVRRFGRLANSQGLDSVFRPAGGDDIVMLSFVVSMSFLPGGSKKEPEALKSGAPADTVMGKYGPKYVYRKSNGLFSVDTDGLADYKDHRWAPAIFKLFGLTAAIEQLDWSMIFRSNNSGEYGIGDFICGTCNMRVLGTGKMLKRMLGIKDPINIYSYVEQYPVEIEYLTVEDYKAMKKERDSHEKEAFVIPEGVQPLVPSIVTKMYQN